MKVLVIGGTLFIGKLLARRLLESGHDVTILHRRPGNLPDSRCRELIADRNDASAFRAAIAGMSFDAAFDNVYDWDRGTTAQQVEATARALASVERYLFVSSVAAYGEGLGRREEDPLAPEDHPDPYVRNKANSERALFRLLQDRCVTVRPPFIYGRGNPFYREAFFWDRLRAGRPILVPEDGQRLMQFILVDDLVSAMLEALHRPQAAGQAFNIANPQPVTQTQIVQALAAAANLPAHLVYVPRQKLVDAGGDAMNPPLYFATYYDLPPITEETSKAQQLLGLTTTPFEQGLSDAWHDYLRQPAHPLQTEWEDQFL